MSDLTDLDEGSIVEYSLAELGFVLVFVLLLLSGWEINTNAVNIKEAEEKRAQLQQELEEIEAEKKKLEAIVATYVPENTEGFNDLILVDKQEYLELKEAEEVARETIDELKGTNEEIEKLNEEIEKLTEDNERLDGELASEPDDPIDGNDGGKIGTIGFCTYETPNSGSEKLYGKSVALGTVLVGEDSITLVAKNSAIQHGSFVDIAGEAYDTTLVTDELEQWPLNQKLSRQEFQERGAKFVEIGDLPSDKRVACRFGMDYHRSIFSEKSYDMEKKILEGSFLRNSKVSQASFKKRFPEYDVISEQSITEFPVGQEAASQIISTGEKNISPNLTPVIRKPEINQPIVLARTSSTVLSRVAPIYPRIAERRGITGIVELAYSVSISGRATGIEVVKEEPSGKGFAKASVTALKQYKFTSATENGVKVISEKQLLRFRF
jgi:hypothetical protein